MAATDSASREGKYVPRNLEDALEVLQSQLTGEQLRFIRDSAPEDMAVFHMGLGMGLRNDWGLWAGSRLARYFNELGVYHPDDMSGIILTSLWRRVHGQPLRVEEQAAYAQRYWLVTAPPKDSIFPDCPSGVGGERVTVVSRGQLPSARQFQKCLATGEWWAYELDRGWFRPDSASLAEAIASW